ncbi:MAG: CHASE2 domain-containing protein [Nitrospiraceae bacterium]
MDLSKQTKKILASTAVGLSVFACAVALHQSRWLDVAELKALDYFFRAFAKPADAHQDLVLMAIDEASLEAYGRWPWPRDRHGYAVRFLKDAGVKAVVFDVMFFEADENAEEFDESFAADVRAAGNVFLPILFQGESEPPAAELLARAQVVVESSTGAGTDALWSHPGVKFPIAPLAKAARGLGFINLSPDRDGTTRSVPLVGSAEGKEFLHLSATVARDLTGAMTLAMAPHTFHLGPITVPLTADRTMLVNWHGTFDQKTYPAYSIGAALQSFAQLQKGERPLLDPTLFKDKIVFIAGTAAGTYDLRVTPLSPYTSGVLIHMAALDNLLSGQFLRPAAHAVSVGAMLALCLGMAWSFMLLQNHVLKIGLGIGLGVLYYGLAVHAFRGHGLWVDLVFPEGALAVTFAVAATVEYLTEGKQRRQLRSMFDRYMGADIVEEITRHPEQIRLGGEKKELSLLFSDVAGFTTISEQLPPEKLVDLLNLYLTAMTDIILRHRGNVNKYLGDGIMAMFGAPLNDPEHATVACYAALDSQKELAALREKWKADGYPEIIARIGINSGPSVVGNVGSQTRSEYTVMGDSVNLASRLEGANKYYDTLILIGPRTFELAKQRVEAREVDRLRVKGKKEPVVVYELLARKGELPDEKKTVIATYLNGLTSYKQRDFATAKSRFEAALVLDPSDGPSNVYRQRAASYLTTPPPTDWDGVYELTSK